MLATNITYNILSVTELTDTRLQEKLTTFLFKSLGQYTDPQEDITACLQYIIHPEKGGHVVVATNEANTLVGVVFLAKTNMHKFVPDYLLVYVATASELRGQGIGRKLIEFARSVAKAPIALHVEHDNPAKKLYERIGFTSKYAEMRWYP